MNHVDWNETEAREVAAPFVDVPGGLLPALHALQARFGHISDQAIAVLADALNLSRAEVHGVTSFYHDFAREPRGRHLLQVCQAESCQAMGSRGLTEHASELLGAGLHQTTGDGLFSVEPVYCLGNCACSPAVRIDDRVFGRVTAERFDALIGEYREAARDD